MNTRTKSFERRPRTATLETWTAIAGLLIGVGALTACGPVADAMDAGGLPGSDVSTPPPDGSAFADAGTTPASGDAAVLPPHPNATCTTGAQCASGFCVDGVCCDRACDGSCESCAPVDESADDSSGRRAHRRDR